jgi:hypothetical protein
VVRSLRSAPAARDGWTVAPYKVQSRQYAEEANASHLDPFPPGGARALAALRASRGMTQRQLADLAGLSPQRICKAESGVVYGGDQ